MKILKSFGKVVAVLMLIASLAVPIALIYGISLQEMEEYQTPVQGEYTPSAYGTGEAVIRMDITESIEVSGNFISTSYVFQELKYEEVGKIRWLVHTGDIVEAGQTLGLYNGKPVVAEVTGIIESMSLSYGDAYIQYTTMDGLALECRVTDKILSILEGGGLTNEAGDAVTLTYTSPLKNTDGTTTVRLNLEGTTGYIGQSVSSMKLYTGRVFYDSLVISENCVYQKDAGDSYPWYVRRISAAGYFIDEVEVTLGYSDGKMVCVTGVSEGDLCDNGYKSVISGQ